MINIANTTVSPFPLQEWCNCGPYYLHGLFFGSLYTVFGIFVLWVIYKIYIHEKEQMQEGK